MTTVVVKGKRVIVGDVWNAFCDRYNQGGNLASYESDSPHIFSFTTDRLALNFARRCVKAGLKPTLYVTLAP